MSGPRRRRTTATAAPAATTRLEVTVTDADTRAPLAGATVTMTGSRVRHPRRKTDARGVWLSNPVAPGTFTLAVSLEHFGAPVTVPPPPPVGPPPPPPLPVVGAVGATVVVPATSPPPKIAVPISMVRAESTVKFLVVDETYRGIPLIGASIKTGALPQKKTKPEEQVELVLKAGRHDVRVKKEGYSQSAATIPTAGTTPGVRSSVNGKLASGARDPGVVNFVVEITTPVPKTVEINLPMTSDWKRVKNSNITVGGTPFPAWFNSTFMSSGATTPANSIQKVASFNAVFDNIAEFRDDPLTLEEFVALFMVMMHETGGDFEAIVEGVYDNHAHKWKEASPKYYFEANASIPKVSYNTGGNRPAGDLLSGRQGKVFATPVLTLADAKGPHDQPLINALNGTTYPTNLGVVTRDQLRLCDFVKYVGRGYVQVTWHSNYVGAQRFVDLLAARQGVSGTNEEILDGISTDDMMTAIESDPAIAFALMKGWFDQGDRWKKYLGVNDQAFGAFGHRVNAGTHYSSYHQECVDLRTAMIAAGPVMGVP